MKKLAFILTCLMAMSACTKNTHNSPHCTDTAKSEWQDKEAFQQKLKDEGYKINEFKVTSTNCYEIYGWDKDENKVEIYYNPVDGSIVKEEKE